MCEGITFAELVSYIQRKLDADAVDFTFNMSDLSRIHDIQYSDIYERS